MVRDLGQQHRPVVGERLVAHEQAEVAPGASSRRICSGGVEAWSASANTWSGGVMWSVAPASRLQRHPEVRESTVPPVDLELAGDQRVVAEQVADDPQVEARRGCPGCA